MRANTNSLILDPRTKLLLLLAVNIVMIGAGLNGFGSAARAFFAMVPWILLLTERKFKAALWYTLLIGGAIGCEMFLVHQTEGILNLLVVVMTGIFARFVPGYVMGYYLITTTKISELTAALSRLHIPMNIIIPFTVMIRFFPTVAEENIAISDSMRMRGIRLGGKNAAAVLEYRIVPMLMSAVKIGEELSAAALTRGLGGTVNRTNICHIGFKAFDILLIILSLLILILWII